MKKSEIFENTLATRADKALGTSKDIAGNASLGALASQLPKVPSAIKAIGKKTLPGLSTAYQALDSAKRASAGDPVGSAIAGVAAVPLLSIPAAAVQAGRDKVRTGSFMPTDDEVAAAAKKDKEAGGTFKKSWSEFDPSYMPESNTMKSNRLKTAIIKEELALKKCSLTEDDLRNTIWIYKDRRGNLFTESGKQIDLNRLNEAPAWLNTIGQGLQTGWNAVKAGGQWAAKNIPPVYQKGKELVGKGAEEVGNLYQAGKKAGTAIGNELVDIPTAAAKKLRGAYQDVRYGTTPDMDPAQRLAHIDDYKQKQAMQDLSRAEVDATKADIANKTRQAKADAAATTRQSKADVQKSAASAEIDKATARDIEAKRPLDWKPAKKIAAGTTAATAAADTALQYDPDKGGFPNYSPGSGLGYLLPEETLGDKLRRWRRGEPDPAPEVTPPAPPAPAPAPAKTEPAKTEPPKEEPVPPVSDVYPDEYTRGVKPKPDSGQGGKPAPGNDKVIAMQKKLKAAGYDLGTFGPEGDGIDGKWGRKTQAAYDAYKADQNLKRAATPDAASRERERIAAQSNLQQAPQASDTTSYGPGYAKSNDPINDVIDTKQSEKVIPEAADTTLDDILWLAGKQRK